MKTEDKYGKTFYIKRGSEAEREDLAGLLVEAFYGMMKPITHNKAKLRGLFLPYIHPERFLIAADAGDKVMGMAALSDREDPCMTIDEEHARSSFFRPKGYIVGRILQAEFDRSQLKKGQGHLECVAVAEPYQKRGIARRLLEELTEETDYRFYTLDVIEGNESVMRLYEKVGFALQGRSKVSLSLLKGYRYEYQMKKLPDGFPEKTAVQTGNEASSAKTAQSSEATPMRPS